MSMLANISVIIAALTLLNYYVRLRSNKSLYDVIMQPNTANQKRNISFALENETKIYENFYRT